MSSQGAPEESSSDQPAICLLRGPVDGAPQAIAGDARRTGLVRSGALSFIIHSACDERGQGDRAAAERLARDHPRRPRETAHAFACVRRAIEQELTLGSVGDGSDAVMESATNRTAAGSMPVELANPTLVSI